MIGLKMNNELKMMWKEAAVAYFKTLYWYMPGEAKKNNENFRHDSQTPA
jgi:hypothetical protein